MTRQKGKKRTKRGKKKISPLKQKKTEQKEAVAEAQREEEDIGEITDTLPEENENLEIATTDEQNKENETEEQQKNRLEEEQANRMRREKVLIEKLKQKCYDHRIRGFDAMRRHDFATATIHFENFLQFSMLNDEETVMLVTQNLIRCRLNGANNSKNMILCVKDCDRILKHSPNDLVVHIAKISALTRLLDFKNATKAIRTACEQDQKDKIEILHTFLYHLHEIGKNTPYTYLPHTIKWPVPKEGLIQYYASLTLPSRQNLLNFSWQQLHKAIDSELCTNMLNSIKNLRPGMKQFLHQCLDFNFSTNPESSLYFLKQEIGCLVTASLWKHFELPEKNPGLDIKSFEKHFIGLDENEKLSVLAENGMYFAQEGSEFVSTCCLDSISLLTQTFGTIGDEDSDEKRLFVQVSALQDLGFEMLHFLAEKAYSDYSHLQARDSLAAKATRENWHEFAKFKLKWHSKIDLKAFESLTPPRDEDDPKLFENKLKELLGPKETKRLLRIELKASKPILVKYAEIISEISGIEQEAVLAELTEGDEDLASDDEDENSEAKKEKEKKDEDYVPVGISVLVQTATFDLKPSNSPKYKYDKEAIIEKLKALEKDVVQFQIDYRNQVFEAAGDNRSELETLMKNISCKGLELTKWLRGFVHYMLDRRDLEQEMLDYCGAKDAKGWHEWYENLSATMTAGQSILLCLLARLFMNNIAQTCLEIHPGTVSTSPSNTPTQSTEDSPESQPTNSPEGPPVVDLEKPVIKEDEKIVIKDKITQLLESEEQLQEPTNETSFSDEKESEMPPSEEKQSENEEKKSTEPESSELEAASEVKETKPEISAKENVKETQSEKIGTEFPQPKKLYEISENPEFLKNLPTFEATTGHRIESRIEALQKFDALNQISKPLMQELSTIDRAVAPQEVKEVIESWLKETLEKNSEFRDKVEIYKKKANVQSLTIPCVHVSLAVPYIVKCLTHPMNFHRDNHNTMCPAEVRLISFMMEHALSSSDSLFHLIYSSRDQKVLAFPTRRSMGMSHIFLCQNCEKVFGTLTCKTCGLAHYCSKACQIAQWKNHCNECKKWSLRRKQISYFTL